MLIPAAVSSAVACLVTGPARPAQLLGVSPAAIYLAVGGGHGVLALLAHDAVRLPCGVLLPTTSAELPLTAIGPDAGAELLVGDGRVSWSRPDGRVVIEIVREWPVSLVGRGWPVPAAVADARAALPEDIGLVAAGLLPASPAAAAASASRAGRGRADGRRAAAPDRAAATSAPVEAMNGAGGADFVRGLLGRGPGLTPSGDDVLAGLLLGCIAFGADARALRAAVDALAPVRTNALSAALLRHAARGECIAEAAAFAAALTGAGAVPPAATRLLSVGHTSGAALALGLLLAADYAVPGAAGPPSAAAGPTSGRATVPACAAAGVRSGRSTVTACAAVAAGSG